MVSLCDAEKYHPSMNNVIFNEKIKSKVGM